jgi:hypothetical protein
VTPVVTRKDWAQEDHDVQVSPSGIWRILKCLDMSRLPVSQRYRRIPTPLLASCDVSTPVSRNGSGTLATSLALLADAV